MPAISPQVERGQRGLREHALLEVQRGAEIAGPEAVAARSRTRARAASTWAAACIAKRRARSSHSSSPVRVKSLRNAKPLPAVPWQRLGALAQRAGRPGQLAAREQEPSSSSAARDAGHDPGRAVAPLDPDRVVALERPPSVERRPVGEVALARPPARRAPRCRARSGRGGRARRPRPRAPCAGPR